MKNLTYALFLLLFVGSFGVQAQNKWQNTYEEAQKLSTEKNLPTLILFSGSDWCKPCIKLKKEIMDTEAFLKATQNKWVLYNADFPYKAKLSKEMVKANEALADKYNADGTFPKVVLIDKNGKILAQSGYIQCTPDAYIAQLEQKAKAK